jgi:hypothetical protein
LQKNIFLDEENCQASDRDHFLGQQRICASLTEKLCSISAIFRHFPPFRFLLADGIRRILSPASSS